MAEYSPIAVARFWSKVDVKSQLTVCWLWRGAQDPNGYGRYRNPDTGHTELSHRVSYDLVKGNVPLPPINLRHTCDNPPCCNPYHCIPGTQADNMRDASERGRLVGVHPDHRDKCARGSDAYHAKLTEAQILEIRARFAAGERPGNLALEFGISPSNMTHITRRKTWTHI
jgi:hypothetical protein